MDLIKKLWPFLFIIILSFFSFRPLTETGFFPIHDDTQVARVYEMGKGLKDGMIPVRWSQDLGYGFGYPIFSFYDPFPYYLGGFISLFTDALAATKIMIVISILIAAFSMYLLANEFWGRWGGILSSLFYVYAPFHAVDIYVRGDFAESFAYAFIPLGFYGIYKLANEINWKNFLITSVSIALIILSHNLTALMIAPFMLLFAIFIIFTSKKNRARTIKFLSFSVLTGLLISAFYWIPTFLEMGYTNVLSQIGGGADFRDHFVCLEQLWSSGWGYGGSARGCIDGFSFMIGKYHIIFALLSVLATVALFLSKKYKDKKEVLLILVIFTAFLISLFLSLGISRGIWEIFTPMHFIQFPWRFLIMLSFFSSLLAGSLFLFTRSFLKERFLRYSLGILLSFFIVLVSIKFFLPQVVLNKTSLDYTDLNTIKWTTSKISDEYMPQNFQKPKSQNEISDIANMSSPTLKVISFSQKTNTLEMKLNSTKNQQVVVPLAFFPSWQANVNGKTQQVLEERKGTSLNIPSGQVDLKFRFRETPIEKTANLLSVAGILILIAGIIHLKRIYA